MKKISLYISALILGAVGFTGCSDDWENPPMLVPELPAPADSLRTISIADLKATYWNASATDYATVAGQLPNGKDAVIVGTIVSSTASNNISKAVYIQDATGAICLSVDTNRVNNVLPMGVQIMVNVSGLYIGQYKGLPSIGAFDKANNNVGRIKYSALAPHIQMGYSGGQVDTTVVSLAELKSEINSLEGRIKWTGRLVRINGVQIMEAGETFCEVGENTNRTITDGKGNYMTLRNSSQSDFAFEKMPYGTGDIVAILSYYQSSGDSWQLLLNDFEGCIDFDGVGAPDDEIPEPELPEGVLTVDEAYNLIETGNIPDHQVRVMGRITSISAGDFSPSFGNLTFYIKDKTGQHRLEIYRCLWLNGQKFTSPDQVAIGQYIIVEGELSNYNGFYEMAQGGRVVQYFGDEYAGGDTPGGSDTPVAPNEVISVAEAIKLINEGSTSTAKVKGVISQVQKFYDQYGQIDYLITDEGGSEALKIYNGLGLNGAKFTSIDDIEVGAKVVVEGPLTSYNGTPELNRGNYLLEYTAPEGGSSTGGSGSGGDNPGTPTPPAGDGTLETFSTDAGFPSGTTTKIPTETPTSYTSSVTGITYTLYGCYIGSYSGSSFLMIPGKVVNGAYVSFTLGYNCKQLVLTTSSGGSTNPNSIVNVYANDTLIAEGLAVSEQNHGYTVDVPAELQAAGTTFKVESATNSYNQQFVSFQYVKAE